jgi:hypothetical protein
MALDDIQETYQTRLRQLYRGRGTPLHLWDTCQHQDDPSHISTSEKNEKKTSFYWPGHQWTHDGQRPLLRHLHPDRNMLLLHGRMHKQIPSWRPHRCHRFLDVEAQF